MAGKQIYFTERELKWILLTMSNQDAFATSEDSRTSTSILEKAMEALKVSK